jgi:hypothetical protein
MPQLQDRKQTRSEELLEFPMTGPFGGTQSELPSTEIEGLGFVDCRNVILRRGTATVRPGYNALTALPDGFPALGIADFFTSSGAHVQAAITKSNLYKWTGSGWTVITGAGFTGSASQIWSWDVIAQKLVFSQGADKIWSWDGVAAGYVQTSANAPASASIAEIGLHLVALNTLEGGTQFPQRYRWSGLADPTDWTSINAGVNDNLNNLGPGQSLKKLGQYGYGWHFNGIIQLQPTGIGTNPFAFYPIVNASLGLLARSSMDHFSRDGIEQAVYLSSDNVYVFNQSSLTPIGDAPLDGRRRVGARSRILADVFSHGTLTDVFGFVTNTIAGQPFNAYWLVIPGTSCWVYNFDESNWTNFVFDKTGVVLGNFLKAAVPRIMDLVGQILAQGWTPQNLVNTSPFPGLAISFSDGTFGYIDFTNYSETAWSITGPTHVFQDVRHGKTLKKFRLRVVDLGQVTYTLTATSNTGQTDTRTLTIGNGSGDVLSAVVELKVSGMRINWKISGSAGSPGSIVEFCPIYSISGEQRGGSSDEASVVIS